MQGVLPFINKLGYLLWITYGSIVLHCETVVNRKQGMKSEFVDLWFKCKCNYAGFFTCWSSLLWFQWVAGHLVQCSTKAWTNVGLSLPSVVPSGTVMNVLLGCPANENRAAPFRYVALTSRYVTTKQFFLPVNYLFPPIFWKQYSVSVIRISGPQMTHRFRTI